MQRWGVSFLSGMIFLCLVINDAYAGANEKDATLETVVVTGTRTEQPIEEVPANVSVINEEDIKNSNAKNIVELLRSEEGIVVRDLLGNGKTAQVDLRGFGETGPYNTLVLVDGRRVNEIDLSGVDWTQIPLEQIERIEIVRGTGTVLYGDNAVGGVINIITKIPSEKFTFKAGGSFGSYGRHKEEVYVSSGGEALRSSLFASYDSTNGYRDNGEFKTKDLGGKIIYDPTEILSLNLSGAHHSDKYGLPSPLREEEVAINRRSTNTPLDVAETSDQYLKLGVDLDLGNYGSIVTDFSYRARESETQWVSFTFAAQGETATLAITPRYVWDAEIFDHTNRLIAGVDLYWSEMDLDTFFGVPLAPSGLTDVERDSYGFYLNNEFSILENLILSIGVRREKVRYDLKQKDLAGFYAPLDDTVIKRESAYSAGLVFPYRGKSSVFIRSNRSFRFPLTDELVVYDFFAGQIRVNSELKPQRGKHYEVGVRHYFTPDIQCGVTLFHAEIKDEIFFNMATFTNENHPETLHQGVEIGCKAALLKKVTVYGNYTYEKATFEKDPFKNNGIPAVPRHRANLGFRLHGMVPGLIFSTDYNYVGSSYVISDHANQFEKLGDYYTLDARLSYEWKRLKGFIGVNNMTNNEYSQYAVLGGFPTARYFYPAPERNWVVGLEIGF